MELNEAVRRIFLQHRLLIVVAVLAGAAVGVALAVGSKGYTASTRMVIDSQDPKARAESTAIADTARAIATSPSLVKKALADAGVTGTSTNAFATDDITVNTLGTSGVIELSVRDRSRRVAATVANALAQEVIRTRLQIATGLARQTQTTIADRITTLDRRIARLDSTLASLTAQLGRGGTAQEASLQARLDQLSRLRDFLTQQRGVLETQQAGLLTSSSVGPMPSVISAATAANATADTSPYRSDAVLGGLLGLILGIGFAVLAESIRPTLAGGEAVARELGTTHLGTYAVDASPEAGTLDGSFALAHELREAAGAAGVRRIDLLAAAPGLELGPIATALESAAAKAPAREPRVSASGPSSIVVDRALRIRLVGPQNLTDGRETGLVVVAPPTLKKMQLAGVAEFIRVTRSPLLGVVTARPARGWWTGIVPERNAAASGAKAVRQT